MVVNPNLPVSVVIGASASNVCSGTLVTFNATTINGGSTPVYQWKVNEIDVGTNSPIFAYYPLNENIVKCTLTSNATCATGSPATSNAITMTVNSNLPASVSISTSASTICSGTSVTFTATPTNGGTTPVYQWKLNGSNVGTNNLTYASSTLANGDQITCVMTSNVICSTGSPATSNTVTMIVNPNLSASVSISASASTICVGNSVTFTATPTNGGTTPIYQWKLNGSNVGINNTTYTNIALANNDAVSCVMTSNATCATGSPATSNTVSMTINPNLPVSVIIAASAYTVCSGTLVTFNATVFNGGSTPVYQWKVNENNVGTNSPIFAYNPLNGDIVKCTLISNATCVTGNPAISNTITMSVNTNLSVSVAIAASGNPVCAGTSVTFTATPTNGGSPPAYQWYKNAQPIGTSSSTYSYTPVTGDKIYVVLTSSLTCATGSPATSNTITMTVNPNQAASVVSISASVNTICAGTSVTFTAAPANGGSTPSYQWKVNGINAGSNTTTYSYIPANSDAVTCVLTSNETCATGSPATSNTVTMTVNPLLPVSVTVAPSANPVCAETSVTYTATPTNGGVAPVYQWKVNEIDVGTNSPIFAYNPLNGDIVKCTLTSNATCATGSPATSNAITMTVNPLLPVSVTVAPSANPVCAGTSVTFTATPTNGGTTPVYQWKLKGSNVGTNNLTYASSTLSNGDQVTCVMTSNATCATGSPATSNIVTMIVNPNLPVSVTVAPSANPVCAGTSVTFTATPTNGGSTPSYQWKVNGINASTNSATYSYVPANNDAVTCVVTSNATCATGSPATSNQVKMVVNPILPVSVSIIASGNPVCTGSTVTFTATPTNGGATPAYQWYINALPIGTNSSTYSYIPVTGDQIYVVLTSSLSCSTGSPSTSNTITMGVNTNLPTSVSIAASINPVCAGTSVTFTATPDNGGSTPGYKWYKNTVLVGSNSSTYTYFPANNDAISCVLTSNLVCATGSPASSNIVSMTVNPNLPVSISVAVSSKTVCSGTVVNCLATPTNGGATPVYQWKVNGTKTGTNNPDFSFIPGNGDVVNCILTSNAVCPTGNPAISADILIAVKPTPTPPVIGTITSPTCNVSTGSVILTGLPYTGTWTLTKFPGGSTTNGTSSSFTISGLAAGSYSYTVTNSVNCTSFESSSIIIDQQPVTPTAPIVGTITVPTCASPTGGVILNGLPESGTWTLTRYPGTVTTTGTGNSAYLSNLSMGTFNYIVTNSLGCVSAASFNVVIPAPPVVPSAPVIGTITQPTCSMATGSVVLMGLPAGVWTINPGNISGTGSSTTILALIAGTYNYSVTNSIGCTSLATSNIVINPQPITPTVIISNPEAVCSPLKVDLTSPDITTGSSLGLTYSYWTDTSATIEYSTPATAGAGTYYIEGTTEFGCFDIKPVIVTINHLPISNAGVDSSACSLNFILNAVPETGSLTGAWTKLGGPGNVSFYPDANQPGAKVTVDLYGTYDFLWTVQNGTCISSDEVRVIFYSVPVVSAGKDTLLCKGNSIQLQGNGTGSFFWQPEDLLNNSDVSNPIATPLTSTRFEVTLTDQVGCQSSDSVFVEVRDIPIADAGPDIELQYLFKLDIDAVVPGTNEWGVWSVFSGSGEFSDSTSAETTVSKLGVGENIILWSVRNGICPVAKDYKVITVYDLVIPTLITPNNDGKNDYFVIRGIETFKKVELVIFNRRGVQVYKNSNYDNSWNGVGHNQNLLPDDTYFFVLKGENGKNFSGYIVIRR